MFLFLFLFFTGCDIGLIRIVQLADQFSGGVPRKRRVLWLDSDRYLDILFMVDWVEVGRGRVWCTGRQSREVGPPKVEVGTGRVPETCTISTGPHKKVERGRITGVMENWRAV